ncbi:MAG: DNA translocase FtsK 4TM domain-containing protein [Anaerolineae bacterium]|nr:DNA translocase FtsK 4TM domain-containing protein [Anaerolineae bacterium]
MSMDKKDKDDDEFKDDDVYYDDDEFEDDDEIEDDDDDDSIGSRIGGRVNPYSGGASNLPGRSSAAGNSPAGGNKPTAGGSSSPTAGSGSGAGSRYGSGSSGSSSPGGSASSQSSPPASGKSDDKGKSAPSGGGVAGRLCGIAGRLGGGGKTDNKDNKKDDKGSKPAESKPGGLASRFGRGGGGKEDDKKASAPKASAAAPSSAGSRLGGLFGRGKQEEKKPAGGSPSGTGTSSSSSGASPFKPSSPFSSRSAGATTTASTASTASATSAPAARKPFGSMGGASSAGAPAKAQAATAKPEGRRFPFFGGGAKKDTKTAPKTRTSKAPKVQGDGLTLDNKLDILGVALVLGSLALFFSTLSSTKGALTEAINRTLGQALGQGAIAVPLAMMAVGLWLIARHFGDEAPLVSPTRIAGIIVMYMGILILLQFLDTFNYTNINSLGDLRVKLETTWLYGRGGGYIGGQLYYLLVSNITELGAFFALLAWLMIGIMLTFNLSLQDIALTTIGTWRSFRDAQGRRNQRIAAKRAELEAQKMAALTAAAVTVTKPEVEQLPQVQEKPALPATAASAPLPEPARNIPISMGGRQVGTVKGDEYVPVETAPATASVGQPAPVKKPAETGGGFLGRLRGSLPIGGSSTPAPASEKPAPPKEEKPETGGLRGRLFNRSSSTPAEAPAPTAVDKPAAAPQGGIVFGQEIGLPGTPSPVRQPSTTTSQPAQAFTAPPAQSPVAPAPASAPAEETPARLGDLIRPAASQPASPNKPTDNGQPRPFGVSPSPYQPAASGQSVTPSAATPPGRPAVSGGSLGSRLNVRPFGAPSTQSEPAASAPAPEKTTPESESEQSVNPPLAQSRVTSPLPDGTSQFKPSPFMGNQPSQAAPGNGKVDDFDDDEDDDEDNVPTGTTPATPMSLAERQDRLNAIRAGQMNKPAETPASTPPIQSRPTTPPPTPASTNARPFGQPTAAPEPRPAAQPPAASVQPPRTEPVIRSTPPPAPPVVSRSAASSGERSRDWKLPVASTLLNPGSEQEFDRESLLQRARVIEDTLSSFGAPGKVVEVNTGPVITQFAVEPDYLTMRSGKKNRVKVSAIAQLDKDMQLALGAKSIRVEAPVPGKGYVGIEVPNEEASLVSLRDVMESDEFKKIKSPLAIALGMSVDGTPVAADLSSMPHLLIAGTTGSGKSVCVNSIITSLVLRNSPKDVKFIMVDPKRVELTGYNGIPHLVAPVVVDLERIVGVLKWVTREMDERYKRFSNAGARNIEDFNKHLPSSEEWMPYIVVIIDELADLMMLAPDETERVITRIAALARATGIHLVIATQRPSVDVVTGLIKANFPARIAFAVAGGVDSRVILDQPGAERLLGRGDMLYMSGDSPAPVRLQGVFVSDSEINNITRFWKTQAGEDVQTRPITSLVLDNTLADEPRTVSSTPTPGSSARQQAFWDRDSDSSDSRSSVTVTGETGIGESEDQDDELYEEALELVKRLNKASVSLLQRRLRIGYTRAARLIDKMEEEGIIGPAESGSKPREVILFDD